jgi:hypothetical protein
MMSSIFTSPIEYMLEQFSPDAASNSNIRELQITIIILHQDHEMKCHSIQASSYKYKIYQTIKSKSKSKGKIAPR